MDSPGSLDRSRFRSSVTDRRVVLAGAAITALAAWLPWAQLESATASATTIGIAVDGFLTLMLAVAVVGLVLIRGWGTVDRAGGLLAGVMVLSLVWKFLQDPAFSGGLNEQLTEAGVSATPAIGVYVTVIGGALLLVGSGLALRDAANEPDASPQD